MIIDRRVLHVYGFNFTALDIDKSRSLGIITRNGKLLDEAQKLFEADFNRQSYTPGSDRLVVSPENARDRLARFVKGAHKQLLIYDPKLTDDAMLKVLVEKAKSGVDVRVIGKVEAKWDVKGEKFPGKRLHVRAIIRDGKRAFIGSQSLRKLELDKRREVGVIVDDSKVIRQLIAVFEDDWAKTEAGKKLAKKAEKEAEKAEKQAQKDAEPVAAAS
jgi:phosphatidylserine/phosphatidylglycerophosphate/cardiolipin synthase-like enzyme